jgi:hypothetical protein
MQLYGVKMKKCQNPDCANHLKIFHDSLDECPSCGSILIKTDEPVSGSRPAAGFVGGALFGWAVGGPAGAIFGSIIGGLLGASVEDEERRKKELDEW